MIPRKTLVQIVAFIVVAVFAAGLWLSGERLEPEWLRFYSAATLVAVAAVALYDHWLWRTPVLQRLPSVPRDIHGTWKGTLSSAWIDPETGSSPPPKDAYLVVRQTSASVSVTLLTDESRSSSSLGKVTMVDGHGTLDYLYLNKPALRVQDRSKMHHGSTVLDVAGAPAQRLAGRYWTDRDSKGELSFTERKKGYADDFQGAVEMFR